MATKICLWSSPRHVSTALMYSFAERSDTTVFDEPLYAHYLKESGYSSAEEVLLAQEIIKWKNILLKEHNEVSFHKLMTHLVNIDRSLSKVTNVLLIRNPLKSFHHTLKSYLILIWKIWVQNAIRVIS